MSSRKSGPNEFWLYVASGGLALFCIFALGRLWEADLRYPIVQLTGDAIAMQACVFKGMIENPWYLDNRWLGAPFGANFRDFAGPDLLMVAVIKLLTVFTNNHNLLRNIIAIASYPLVTLSSLFVMRRLGVRFGVALAASVLFAFISYHHVRVGPHLFLGVGYFTVPFATLMSLWFLEDKPLFVVPSLRRVPWRIEFNRVTWVACLWCAVMGMTGSVYYSYFSCYLFAIAGTLAALKRGTVVPLVRATCGITLVGLSMLVGVFPVLIHHWKHGSTTMLDRIPQDAETYGLKIVQMLLPGTGHRLTALDRLSSFYNKVAPVVTENCDSYLGLVGGAGFLYLIFRLLRGESRESRTLNLGIFNISVVLLATVGGFSSVISFLFSSTIRSYNRASVFIAFFSLLALALLAERVAAKWANSQAKRVTLNVGLVAVTCLGLLDQYARSPDYPALKKAYVSRGKFVMEIESAVPPGSSIFQYPFFPYPENGPIYQLLEYTEFLPYLHSKSLRWSYGTIKGRSGAAWQANIAGMPTDRAVDALAQAGFMGVYVARDGYRDHGAALEEALRSKLGQPVATSSQGDAAFYPLAARVQQLKAEQGEQEYERRKQEALTPMFLGWLDGCHPADVRGITQSVWCGAKGRFVVDNPSATPVHVLLGAKLKLAGPPPATVRLRSDVVEHEIDIGTASYDMWEGFDVPPGEHFFTITTSGEGAIDERGRQRQITLDGAHLEVIVRSGPFEDQK